MPKNFGAITDPKDITTKQYVDNAVAEKQAKITASGVLIGNGSGGVTAKTLDTSSLTDDNNHVPTSGVVKSALIFVPDTGNAGYHNSIYRGKYLGTSVTAAQYAAISAGTFDDLFIGDYWTINSANWRIAAFDYWLHDGDIECTTHHALIVPDTSLYSTKMNDSTTTTGAYVGSKMYTTNLGTAKSIINSAFGSSHILSHREMLTNATANNAASGSAWYDSTVEIMSEIMVFGHFAWGIAGASSGAGFETGNSKSQLPLFRLDESKITNRTSWWLRNVRSSTGFAMVGEIGTADRDNADTDRLHYVRPVFAIKA